MKIEPAAAIRGTFASPATSRSRTARCCSARSPTARRASRASAARPTPRRRSRAVRALGVEVYEADDDTLRVFGVGLRGLQAPAGPIDCGNAAR